MEEMEIAVKLTREPLRVLERCVRRRAEIGRDEDPAEERHANSIRRV